jgi:hypothetical protein
MFVSFHSSVFCSTDVCFIDSIIFCSTDVCFVSFERLLFYCCLLIDFYLRSAISDEIEFCSINVCTDNSVGKALWPFVETSNLF